MRRCTGACRRELPETADFFHRNGEFWAACCRECRSAERSGKRARRGGYDPLHNAVRQVHVTIDRTYQRMDPDGAEERAFRDKLGGLCVRYRDLALKVKVRTLSWLLGELLNTK